MSDIVFIKADLSKIPSDLFLKLFKSGTFLMSARPYNDSHRKEIEDVIDDRDGKFTQEIGEATT